MTGPLTVLFDFRDPYSYLALRPTWELIDETGVMSRWYPFLSTPLKAPVPVRADADRGARHRWQRACYYEQDLQRYAQARQLPAGHFFDGGLYRPASGEVAAMGFNWVAGTGPAAARAYLQTVFEGYWDGDLSLDAMADIESALSGCGAEVDGFDVYCEADGIEELFSQRTSLIEEGAFATPAYLLDEQIYLGRQHLPMLRSLLEAP